MTENGVTAGIVLLIIPSMVALGLLSWIAYCAHQANEHFKKIVNFTFYISGDCNLMNERIKQIEKRVIDISNYVFYLDERFDAEKVAKGKMEKRHADFLAMIKKSENARKAEIPAQEQNAGTTMPATPQG